MIRTFTQTHPWLTFQLDLRNASPRLWMLLGEARSKCEHICNVPLLPTTARKLHQLYLIKGVVATTAIEGNTLSEDEVQRRLDGELQLPASKEYLGREIDNLIGLINGLVKRIERGELVQISPALFKELNRGILEGLPLDDGVVPGEIRKHSVTVGRYLGAPAEDCEFLLGELSNWLNGEFRELRGPDWAVALAILKAVLAHVYIAWIHPFGDGNGRTARLVEFLLLVVAGVPTAAAHLLSNHYNRTRSEYYRQLDRASKSGGDLTPFVEYALTGFTDELRIQLAEMHRQHRELLWRQHVEVTVGGPASEAKTRQMELAMVLGRHESSFEANSIKELSSKLTASYATKTGKTLARDLHTLEHLGLIVSQNGGYRAKTELISAMLPVIPALNATPAPAAELELPLG